jgi:H+-transporting ATPase
MVLEAYPDKISRQNNIFSHVLISPLPFRQFAEQLYQPMPLMIWMAIIIEAAIESWPDMGILLAIQFLNASLSYYETTKAGDAVAALKASLKPLAYVKRDGKFLQMDAALLVPGDLVLLGAGGAVPADCVVKDSQIDVDQVP